MPGNNGISGTNTNKTTKYRTKEPKFLVITNSASSTPEEAIVTLYNKGNSASVHYFIDKHGKQTQFQLENNQSFTCGKSRIREKVSLNETAITLMFINTGNELYPEKQKIKFIDFLQNFKKKKSQYQSKNKSFWSR